MRMNPFMYNFLGKTKASFACNCED